MVKYINYSPYADGMFGNVKQQKAKPESGDAPPFSGFAFLLLFF
jgi:hypothetical protein